jgi:hypothetical protein
MRGHIIWVTGCRHKQWSPTWIGYISPTRKPDISSLDCGDRSPTIIFKPKTALKAIFGYWERAGVGTVTYFTFQAAIPALARA